MKGLLLSALALAIGAPAAAQVGEPGGVPLVTAVQSGKSPFREIPEGHNLVHWDDLNFDHSLGYFWFSKADEWRFVKEDLDDGAGNVAKGVGPALFFKSSSTYKSRVRAPHSIALVKNLHLSGNFVLEVEMMQTGVETAHRDLCLFFGFEGPERFFYNHLGKRPDPHSSNVFDVNGADRVRIGAVSREEIDWGRGVWHRVRLECEWNGAKGGRVRTYFDDMETPAFEKPLYREAAGFIGLGSFDDAGAFRNLHVWAKEGSKLKGHLSPFGGEVVRRLWTEGASSGGLDILGAGSAKVWILENEYRVGMVRTVDGAVMTRDGSGGFFFDDGGGFPEADEDGKVTEEALKAWRAASRKEYRWVISDAGALGAAAGLVGLDDAIVLECGLAVTAEPVQEPDTSSGFSLEPIYGMKLRVEPAKESRSSFLAKKYRARIGASPGDNPEGIWRWTTDLEGAIGERLDPRPILLAITPPAAGFSAHLDAVLEPHGEVQRAMSAKFRCLRVDPTVIAGPSVRWPESIPIDGRGSAKCLVLDRKGQILRAIDEELPPPEFLASLLGK